MRLKDKVAVVTGGASGIGKAIATRYAAEGARVAIADLDAKGAADLAATLGHGAFGAAFDCTRQDSIDALVSTVTERAGGIDILVNNAGVFAMDPIEDVTRAQWTQVFAVNAEGTFFTLQAVAKQMIRQGRGGKIVNLASQAGRRGEALVAVYCASKAAVISLTQSAGLGLIRHRINVNAIAPGVVDTPMWDFVDREFGRHEGLQPGEKKRLVGRMVPFGRMGLPEDLAGMAVFLATPDADYIVAQTYGVDGGNWMA
ncbi:MAG TPA: L-iditol 2-dehydrogenase [Acetobacteraceae bacterium]|nr:L-iditol 2-dehydrogenase [Acetobacteraceae bacterium]